MYHQGLKLPSEFCIASFAKIIGFTYMYWRLIVAECGVNCHKKCEKNMPNLCGVNQKIFAEALSKIKKTATPGAKSGTKNATTSEGGEGEVIQ